MSFKGKSVSVCTFVTLLVCAVLIFAAQPVLADVPDLVVRVGDSSGLAGAQKVAIPVRIYNYFDTVDGFEIRLTTDRPDLISFRQEVDTVGALVAGWEMIGTEILGAGDDTLRVVGMADWLYPTTVTPGIGFPQLEPTPLVRLLVDVAALDPASEPQLVNVKLLTEDPLGLIFSTDGGKRAIGINTDTIIDTTWYICSQWQDPDHQVCLQWDEVYGPPADSMAIDSTRIGWLDTTAVYVYGGTLRIEPWICGDVSREDGLVTLSDITFLISYLYLHGPEPPYTWAANVDGSEDEKVTLSDIAILIDHVYISKEVLDCR